MVMYGMVWYGMVYHVTYTTWGKSYSTSILYASCLRSCIYYTVAHLMVCKHYIAIIWGIDAHPWDINSLNVINYLPDVWGLDAPNIPFGTQSNYLILLERKPWHTVCITVG